MTLATRNEPEAPIELTRTRGETLRWVVATAVTLPPRETREKRVTVSEEDALPIILMRVPGETLRWFLVASPIGIMLTVLAVALGLAGIVGIWFAVPIIDRFVVSALAAASDGIDWFIETVRGIPAWAETFTGQFS